MKISIGASIETDYGYEEKLLVSLLRDELKKLGHTVDTFFVPYYRDMFGLPEQLVAYQMMSIDDTDMLITIGYPACYLNHQNKVVFLFNLAPMINEYYDTEYGVLARKQYENIKNLIRDADGKILGEAKQIFVNSKQLQVDVKNKFNLKSTVMYLPDLLRKDNDIEYSSDKYIVTESNLFPESRYELILDAMQNVEGLSLLIFVPRTDKIYRETLEKYMDEFNVRNRVKIFETHMPKTILDKAASYITMDYNLRRIGNGISRAVEADKRLIIAEDGMATLELSDESLDVIVKPDSIEICKAINSVANKNNNVKRKNILLSISDIASKMVNI